MGCRMLRQDKQVIFNAIAVVITRTLDTKNYFLQLPMRRAATVLQGKRVDFYHCVVFAVFSG